MPRWGWCGKSVHINAGWHREVWCRGRPLFFPLQPCVVLTFPPESRALSVVSVRKASLDSGGGGALSPPYGLNSCLCRLPQPGEQRIKFKTRIQTSSPTLRWVAARCRWQNASTISNALCQRPATAPLPPSQWRHFQSTAQQLRLPVRLLLPASPVQREEKNPTLLRTILINTDIYQAAEEATAARCLGLRENSRNKWNCHKVVDRPVFITASAWEKWIVSSKRYRSSWRGWWAAQSAEAFSERQAVSKNQAAFLACRHVGPLGMPGDKLCTVTQ